MPFQATGAKKAVAGRAASRLTSEPPRGVVVVARVVGAVLAYLAVLSGAAIGVYVVGLVLVPSSGAGLGVAGAPPQ